MKTSNKVEITLHGHLGEAFKPKYSLYIKSVSEAIKALDSITHRRLSQYLIEKDKIGAKYRVLINGRDFLSEKPVETPEDAKNSELVVNIPNLQTIDFVPVLQGADSGVGQIIAGVLLIIVGIVVAVYGGGPLGGAIIMAGIGLIAGGIITLLSKPPKFEDFRDIQNGGKTSYLFSGPQNTTNEGGPVPVGYGRLLVGSQVIAASYQVSDQSSALDLTI